jgi:hypothetical protein
MQSLSLVNVAIPAAGSIANNLAGQAIEYQGEASVLTLYGNSDDAATTHTLFGNRGSKSDVFVPPGSVIGVGSTAAKVKNNEDFIGQYPLSAGTRLVHQITGTATKHANFLYIVA